MRFPLGSGSQDESCCRLMCFDIVIVVIVTPSDSGELALSLFGESSRLWAQAQPAPVQYCEAHLSSPCAMFSYVRAHASREVALQAFRASVWRRAPLPFLRHWPSSSTCMQQSSNCKYCMPQLSSDSIAPDLAPSIMKALTLHLLHLRGRHCQLPHNYSDEGPQRRVAEARAFSPFISASVNDVVYRSSARHIAPQWSQDRYDRRPCSSVGWGLAYKCPGVQGQYGVLLYC